MPAAAAAAAGAGAAVEGLHAPDWWVALSQLSLCLPATERHSARLPQRRAQPAGVCGTVVWFIQHLTAGVANCE